VVLEANEDYWGGAPGLEKVIWKQLPDTNTVITQLKTGEVDMAPVQPAGYSQLKDLPNLKVTIDARSIYLHMTFNLRNPILADRNLRQALAYGLPRQLIVDT
jgi:peptide/nickel transport system substrate-binding protein